MFDYSLIQWLLYFYFYCFCGWVFESVYVSIKDKKWTNRGFMRGPFLPIYGSGAIVMLLVSKPVEDNIFLVYIMGCLGATALEYVTGVVMEAIFKVRYWDYSDEPFNYKGQICLKSTLAWGILTILMTYVVHKPVEAFVCACPQNLVTVVVLLLTAVIFSDFAVSFKAAIDLRDMLIYMERTKKDMEILAASLDLMLDNIESSAQIKRLEMDERILGYMREMRENKVSMERKWEDLKETVASLDVVEDFKTEMAELREKFNEDKNRRLQIRAMLKFNKFRMINSNPRMSSRRFAEALEELKDLKAEFKEKVRDKY